MKTRHLVLGISVLLVFCLNQGISQASIFEEAARRGEESLRHKEQLRETIKEQRHKEQAQRLEAIENWFKNRQEMKGKAIKQAYRQKNLTRAEAVMVIAKFKKWNIAGATQAVFLDVPARHWAAGYIQSGKDRGLLKGYGDEYFRPEREISLGEFLTMLSVSENFKTEIFNKTKPRHWAEASFKAAQHQGLISNNLQPDREVLDSPVSFDQASELLSALKN